MQKQSHRQSINLTRLKLDMDLYCSLLSVVLTYVLVQYQHAAGKWKRLTFRIQSVPPEPTYPQVHAADREWSPTPDPTASGRFSCAQRQRATVWSMHTRDFQLNCHDTHMPMKGRVRLKLQRPTGPYSYADMQPFTERHKTCDVYMSIAMHWLIHSVSSIVT